MPEKDQLAGEGNPVGTATVVAGGGCVGLEEHRVVEHDNKVSDAIGIRTNSQSVSSTFEVPIIQRGETAVQSALSAGQLVLGRSWSSISQLHAMRTLGLPMKGAMDLHHGAPNLNIRPH